MACKQNRYAYQEIPAHEEFDGSILRSFDRINFERRWDHLRTVIGRLANAFVQSTEYSADREILYLRAGVLTQEEIAQRLGFKSHSAVVKRLNKLWKRFKTFQSK